MRFLEVTYSKARANLADLMDRATADREVVIIKRRNKDDVVLLARDEFESLSETLHLLRSPANRRRLFEAMEAAKADEGTPVDFLQGRYHYG